jgi:hypothetical protein
MPNRCDEQSSVPGLTAQIHGLAGQVDSTVIVARFAELDRLVVQSRRDAAEVPGGFGEPFGLRAQRAQRGPPLRVLVGHPGLDHCARAECLSDELFVAELASEPDSVVGKAGRVARLAHASGDPGGSAQRPHTGDVRRRSPIERAM